ncbi:magnesium-translocating P-type ATPase [Paratissierella segnis]|jgi:Mg2+-importing ATPase|uniref:Magnesium-transporting ATPase, P-type 1 n=1 Tax=Paratissierella segnis TaxID=2763679 RepID=A0A926EUL9_9FIRM|nr:magnesium-translocating P-type ATPase [Paratissierella segnis]MBC8587807.1 magnesium-translocating P-type ATPase [Paratissierella segnis]
MNNRINQKKLMENKARHDEVNKRLLDVSKSNPDKIYDILNSSKKGKTKTQIKEARDLYGDNVVTYNKDNSLFKRFVQAFINPFTVILIALAIVSAFTDIILVEPGEKDFTTVVIIVTMVLISGILRFVQEFRSGNAAEKLLEMIETTASVERIEEGIKEIPLDEIVVGDIVYLSAGDMVPADMRIIQAKDLFISQSALTGESETVEKTSRVLNGDGAVLDRNNLAFMGTNAVSGSAKGIVVSTGNDTIFGEIAQTLNQKPTVTSFEKGVNAVSWVLIKFMLVMVPIVFFVNGFTKGDWLHALLFAISIAVGLTPEMLPMIVTTSLAKGAVAMSKKKVIIKNLNSIQNLGAIDILCTDKTGTLTEDKVKLQYHLDINGNSDTRVLRHGFLNSYYQTGLKNLIDIAIIDKTMELMDSDKNMEHSITRYKKVDEVPFDFSRRRMSVVVEDETGKTQMITKGAVEEMLTISNYVEYEGVVVELTEEKKEFVLDKVNELNNNGMRVIAVSQKTNPSPVGEFSIADENDMVLIGYLAFLDPPKKSAITAIEALKASGVDVKILTGDNEEVTKSVCRQVGIKFDKAYLGSDVEKLSDEELGDLAEEATVFAKMSPSQKTRVINILREKGHSVGYMGDGINDAGALEASDVGISVDNAVDIAKESADVILLEKDLMVLENGILEGRKTYANMIKYIKMTASSNFGNVLSVLVASAFLPFLPMEPLHLILLNLIYDISCTAIPWDNVDKEFLEEPKEWDASLVSKFMLWIGPTSSVFDITTYLLMYYIIAPMFTGGLLFHQLTDPKMMTLYIAVFQAGWFVESMWSQTLVIHMIRTPKIPFIQSRASNQLTLLTFAGIAILTVIPFTGFGASIGLAPLPKIYFLYLAIIIILYMVLATIVKKLYVRRYKELL